MRGGHAWIPVSVVALSGALIAPSPTNGQVPAAGQTGDAAARVLDEARAAIGAGLSAMKMLVVTGRTRQVRGDSLVPIEFEIQVELPERFARRDEFPAQDAGPTVTGFDENGDLVFNDRPAGVDRNTQRAPTQWTINPAAAYTFLFGRQQTRLPPGISVIAGGAGAPTVQTFDQNAARFRLQFVVQVQNLTNRPNYVGYSGVLTSPFFGQPTAVTGTRKVDVSAQVSF